MIKISYLAAFSLLFTSLYGNEGVLEHQTEQQIKPQVEQQKLSQAFGHVIGQHLDTPGIQFDLESVIQGMRDAASGKPSPLSEQEYEEAMSQLQEKAFNEAAAKNLQQAEEFLKKNKQNKGVVEVENGKLQYLIVLEGTGPAVAEHSVPLINYSGKFIDGKVFSSSQDKPVTIPLDQAIAGFSRGIVGMKEGEKRTLFIHPELAYGTSGQMPPNSLLIFEIEVVKAKSNLQVQTPATSGQAGAKTPTLRDVAQ